MDGSEERFNFDSAFHFRLLRFADSSARLDRHAGEQVTFFDDGGAVKMEPQITHFLSIMQAQR